MIAVIALLLFILVVKARSDVTYKDYHDGL